MSTFAAGQVLTAAELNAIFDPLSNAWTAYTPTLTNLTIGNGTVSGRYLQVGKSVYVMAIFTLGSTSAVGTKPRISLPVTQGAATCLAGMAYDSSADTLYAVTAQGGTGSGSVRFGSGSGEVAATVPFTWAVSDQLNFAGVFEAL